MFQNLESEFRKELQGAWRVHWDHQLYKALEYQYHRGLETLNEAGGLLIISPRPTNTFLLLYVPVCAFTSKVSHAPISVQVLVVNDPAARCCRRSRSAWCSSSASCSSSPRWRRSAPRTTSRQGLSLVHFSAQSEPSSHYIN